MKKDSLIRSIVHGRGLVVLVCAGLLIYHQGDADKLNAAITQFGLAVAGVIAIVSKVREAMGKIED